MPYPKSQLYHQLARWCWVSHIPSWGSHWLVEAFSLVTLAPLPWILWRTSFPLPPPSLKAAPCFAETSLSLGARTLLSTNNFRTFSFSDDPWTQEGCFQPHDSGPELKYLSMPEPQTPRETHSIRANEDLPAAASLPVVLHPWKLDTNESIPSSLHLNHSGQF